MSKFVFIVVFFASLAAAEKYMGKVTHHHYQNVQNEGNAKIGMVAAAMARAGLPSPWQHGHSALRHNRGKTGGFLQSQSCTHPKGLKSSDDKMATLTEKLKSQKPFTFFRWGDGEWFCALKFGMSGNSDGVNLRDADMCGELQRNLLSYGSHDTSNLYVLNGFFFMCEETHSDTHERIEDFLKSTSLTPTWKGFQDDGFYFPLVPEMQKGRKPGVFPSLQGRTVVVVGPKHLRKLSTALNYVHYIETPGSDAWSAREAITDGVLKASQKWPNDNVVFLWAGGPAAKVLMYNLHGRIGQKDTLIDVGSSLDGFAGVHSRDYNDLGHYCHDYPEYVVPGLCPQ